MGSARTPRVYSIPPGVPYLATFAQAYLAGEIIPGVGAQQGPLQLAGATIYVPTRRAARALAAEFATLSETPVTLLPRIVPLGQLDAIETGLMFEAPGEWNGLDDLPDAIGEMQRRLALVTLIQGWARISARTTGAGATPLVAPSPAYAWQLAGDLAGLMDDMTIEGVPWERLDKLAPEEFDKYWDLTLKFLRIATTHWPAHLREIDRMDRAARQVQLVEAEIARIAAQTQGEPLVAIGSTGTNKSTARLLAALARAPLGAVVLPGLDTCLDEASWSLIPGDREHHIEPSAGHPQMALHRLLQTIGIGREDVVEIGRPDSALQARRFLLSEALRPADTTEAWQTFHERSVPGGIALALEGVTLIEAADDREEALALALLMREALETPGKTASLVTPDRALAARVRAELARWDITVDDSGGERLAATPEGALACLTLAAACEAQPSLALLALLSHPLCRLGRASAEVEQLTRFIDIAVLRLPIADHADARAVVAAARKASKERDAHPATRRMGEDDWAAVTTQLIEIEAALLPLRAAAQDAPLSTFATTHLTALQTLMQGVDTFSPGIDSLQELLDELAADKVLQTGLDDYRALFDQIASETVVRGPAQSHPRLKILGLLEARLLHADMILLGGLDETVWPPQTSTDAFLNRPMRAELGLSSPERRIGQTAHDFMQALGTREAVISRAQKRGGSPTVPSRFLQRLAALAGEVQWSTCRARGARALALAHALDGDGESGTRATRPMPTPPLALRPTSLSVTSIETLRRDPYSIYAGRILALKPLEPIGAEAGARMAGILLHDVLARFIGGSPNGPLPPDADSTLIENARLAFADLLKVAAFRAFNWPRQCFALRQFLAWERDQREGLSNIDVEQNGALTLTLADRSEFTLTGIADRIERKNDGTLRVIDYKSGRVPSAQEIKAGFAPQLTIEAAMIERGAFAKIPAQRVGAAVYLKLGGADGLAEKAVKADNDTPFQTLVDEQFAGLQVLLNEFRNVDKAYMPRPYPQFIDSYGAYDHLARVKEWSAGVDGNE